MKTNLIEIQEDVREWLKFAEAKNFGLLSFCGAFLFLLIQRQKEISKMSFSINFLFGIICLLLIISSVIMLLSFYPRIFNKKYIKKNGLPVQGTNFRFYMNIAKFSPEKYLDALKKAYNENSDVGKNELDLSTQIVQLSEVCLIKYNLFRRALLPLIFSFILLSVLLALIIFK